MKQFDKALLIYENLFNEKKASSEEIDNLIRIYKHKDDTENSLRVMKGALKMSPEKNSLRYDYALLLTHDGQYEPAFEQARYLWQSRPNDNGFINLLLRLAGYLNDFDTMILVYESMLAWAPFEEKPHIFRSLANLYAEKGRPERAFNYWMRLSEQLTDDPEAVRAIYEYYDKTENIQGAAEYLEKLLLLEPDKKLENTLKLLTLYTSLFAYSSYSDSKPQKDDKIEELLQSSLKIWPHETRLLVKGISFFMQKADYKQALDLLKALPAREQQARALEFALCYEKAGNLEESFNLYRKAVDTEFTVIAVLGASRTGRRLKALNTVENILNKALEKFDDKELLLEYARFLNDSGKPDRAGEYLESKKAIMPGYAPYWAVLGEVLVKLNNTKNALTAYEKAIDLSPDEPDYLLSGAKIAAGLSNYSQAVDLLKRFLAHNPDHEEAETLLATAYLRSGKPDLAKKHFKNIAGRHPENFLARENLGNLYFNEQDYAKAIAFYLRALEISPKRSAAVFKLASAYKNNSNTEKAIKYFRLLLKMEDAAPEIKRHAVQIVKELEESIKNGEKK
jgi:tetratricopeptide (TPR) repeat protein